MATNATLIEGLQQLLFAGESVEHSRLALRLRQIADTLVAADAVERGAVRAKNGSAAASAHAAITGSTSDGVETACEGARAGTEGAELQPADAEHQLQSCRPPRSLGKGKKHRGAERLGKSSSVIWNQQRAPQ